MPRANTTSTSGHGSAETIGTCALSSPGVVTAAAVPATTASRRAHLMTSILQPNLRKPDLDASWRSGGFSSSDGKALAGDSESDNVTRRHCVAGFTAAATAPDRGYSSTLATWTPLRVRRRRCEVLPVGRRFRNPPRGSSAVAVSAAGASRVADSGSPPGLSMLSGELRRPPRPPAPPAPCSRLLRRLPAQPRRPWPSSCGEGVAAWVSSA